MQKPSPSSYRALLAVPSAGRLMIGMQIARIGQSMVNVAMVLYTLEHYGSPSLAGIVGFFSMFPGLVFSPIAGALLDRHGRTRLVVVDYLVTLASLMLIGILAVWGNLPSWLLVSIAAVASLTSPLSWTGVRSLLPMIVPSHLWERLNALDSAGYVISMVVGPPLAALIVSVWGGPVTFIVIALCFGLAAFAIAGARDRQTDTVSTGDLLHDAWQGMRYSWRNRTLRGLGFCISVLNLNFGIFTIVIPLIVLERLHQPETVVGLVLATQGIAGLISAIVSGRMNSSGRERMMLVLPMIGTGVTLSMLLLKPSLPIVILVMFITGILNGPLDIALFTLRQRRTDKAWTGRAFAISMSFNALGLPIGSAIAGGIAAHSITTAVTLGVITSFVAAILAARMIPQSESNSTSQ